MVKQNNTGIDEDAPIKPVVTADEKKRLKALSRYDVLNSPSEQSFDRVASMATTIFRPAGAIIAFIDLDRVWIKANTSPLSINFIPREHSFCSHTMLKDDITVIEDTRLIPSLSQNPYIYGDKGIRFYADALLKSYDGYILGSLCIFDYYPRKLTERDKQLLKELAAVVVDELEMRLSAKKAVQLQSEMLNMVVHNLKNPLSGILGLSQLLPDFRNNEAELKEMSSLIADTSEKMLDSLNELLQLSKLQEGEIKLQSEPVNIVELVRSVIQDNSILARQKSQEIIFNEIPSLELTVDRKRMREIVDNLLSNSIKYTPLHGEIKVSLYIHQGWLRIVFKDNGQGFTAQELSKVFQKFANISSEPTGNESSTGIGLSIVKTLVELHEGNVWVESEGKDQGSTFVVELPLPQGQ